MPSTRSPITVSSCHIIAAAAQESIGAEFASIAMAAIAAGELIKFGLIALKSNAI
jgi:hypothetical protein